MPHGVIAVDSAQRVVMFNRAAEGIWEVAAADLCGQPLTALQPPLLASYFDEAAQTDPGQATEPRDLTLRRTDGSQVVLAVSLMCVAQDARRLTVAFVRDVTRQREHEARMRNLSLAVDRSDTALITLDASLGITYVNAGFTRLFGYTLEQMRGKRPTQLLSGPHSDPDTMRYIYEQAANWRKFSADLLMYRSDGRPLWTSIIANPVNDEAEDAERVGGGADRHHPQQDARGAAQPRARRAGARAAAGRCDDDDLRRARAGGAGAESLCLERGP